MKSKKEKIAYFNSKASDRERWRAKNRYYHSSVGKLIDFLVPQGKSVLDIGCGTGSLEFCLKRENMVGVDFAPEMLAVARDRMDLGIGARFIEDDVEDLKLKQQFDYVILSDLIGELQDVWEAIRNLHKVTHDESRIIITYYNALWEPVLKLAEKVGWKMPQDYQNWLSLQNIENLMRLNDFEIISSGYDLLLPKYIPGLSHIINKYIAKLPLVNQLCLSNYIVARPAKKSPLPVELPSVTVLIPCRNEKGNIENGVQRVPMMGRHTEILFVDGNSNDGTVEEIERVIAKYKGKLDIKLLHQVDPGSSDGAGHGKMLKLGKGDAVRKGFLRANGDILMILDADLTVPPEDLPKFYHALLESKGEFINGSRLVYPMEKEAMRSLNKIANKFFGMMFSWLLGQQVTDTLCGTKALYKKDYLKIVEGRAFFGDFDPFGDFDLLFGAAKQNLQIREVPIRYRERVYGDIKIERFKHGLLLFKMTWIAMKKLKFRW
ncbi:MAG: bifunctional class I SAM-dependent methyltransferase/glycosyltransferase family 2 protein [Desulfobulbaceae bacterium]|nr:bifunctional class I SAM-dependent methyltransferase/glycosyltransferase family 2 protein [Desulfobulbaceae bacterium]